MLGAHQAAWMLNFNTNAVRHKLVPRNERRSNKWLVSSFWRGQWRKSIQRHRFRVLWGKSKYTLYITFCVHQVYLPARNNPRYVYTRARRTMVRSFYLLHTVSMPSNEILPHWKCIYLYILYTHIRMLLTLWASSDRAKGRQTEMQREE